MTLAFVVGRGGLLGSNLARHLTPGLGGPPGPLLWWPSEGPFAWSDPDLVAGQIDRAFTEFFDAVVAGGHDAWALYWAGGASIVGSTAAALAAETRTFEFALTRMAVQVARLSKPTRGQVFLASSAGGTYGRCPDSPATEASACVPISDYGREKLRQEAALAAWGARTGVSTLVGRISNLYGPGQNLDKPQGLISHLVRSLVLARPVHLYVSLDTLRDYIHVDDCAAAIVQASARLAREAAVSGPQHVCKIFASEQATSISSLIGIVTRVTQRRPLVIHASRPETELQPRRLSFRSAIWREDRRESATTLPVGVSQVHRDILEKYRHGRLAPRA